MDEAVTSAAGADHRTEDLSSLFYFFRLAQLSYRYYYRRLAALRRWDKAFSIVVALSTALSFALLLFVESSYVKTLAAILSAVAFVVSTVLPPLALSAKIEAFSAQVCAWHYAAQQIEAALRFVKNSDALSLEAVGWVHSAEVAYQSAAALPNTEVEDRKLVKKVEDEINEAFPANYVWTAF